METPVSPTALTTDWLTDTLRAAGVLQQACVTARTIQDLGTEKGMTGQLARVRLAHDQLEPAAPRALIVKCSAADPQARVSIHAMGFYEREVRFYAQLAARSPLRTPRCYFSALDLASGHSLLLLEDLAPARNGSWVAGCSVAEAERAVRTIARFHAAWWQHRALAEERWLALRGPITADQAAGLLQDTWEPFLSTLGTRVTPELLQIGAWLEQHIGRLVAYLYQAAPATLIHNDYQADNLFFAGSDTTDALVVADWQLTTAGRGPYDVAFFVGGHLAPQERRDHEHRLLHTYHMVLRDHGVADYSFEQCVDDYRLAMLHPIARIATVVGLGAVPRAQEAGYCDVLLPRYCRAVHELKVGEVVHAYC